MTGRGYTGEIAGVRFEDGRPVSGPPADPARTLEAVRGYARRHGLTVTEDGLFIGPAPTPRQVDSRDAGITPLGAPLRDAADDPRPGDYLPPVNAGLADPHSPAVVSPEIHGSGPGPVVPGEVADDPAVQAAAESAAVAEVTGVALVGPEPAEIEIPARNDSKADWVTYALSVGGDPDEIGALTKAELLDRYLPKTSEATDGEPREGIEVPVGETGELPAEA